MNHAQKVPFHKNLLLKIISLMLGYGLWYSLSSNSIVSLDVQIPLYAYNTHDNCAVSMPENVTVTLKAVRSLMRHVPRTTLAAHIDAHTLHKGINYLSLSAAHLLLPKEITVAHYTPIEVIATLA